LFQRAVLITVLVPCDTDHIYCTEIAMKNSFSDFVASSQAQTPQQPIARRTCYKEYTFWTLTPPTSGAKVLMYVSNCSTG